MTRPVTLAGYQGSRSILTRSLAAFAEALPSARLVADVTAHGIAAQTMFAGLDAGDYDAAYMSSGYLTARVPALSVLDAPFTISDRHRAYAALDGAAGAILRREIEAATNLVVLGFWDNGFRHLTNARRPIRAPGDCAGLTLRTLNNRVYQDAMAALGFTPVVTDVKELVEAVRSGRVDAQENPLANTLVFGLEAWHGHASLTGHIFGVALLVANRDWWHALPTDALARLRVAADGATRLQRELAEAEERDGVTTLRDKGVAVLTAGELDLAAFRVATTNVREAALRTIPRTLIDAYIQHD